MTLTTANSPQAQRFAYTTLFRAARYLIDDQDLDYENRNDAYALLIGLVQLVKMGKVEMEEFKWDPETLRAHLQR